MLSTCGEPLADEAYHMDEDGEEDGEEDDDYADDLADDLKKKYRRDGLFQYDEEEDESKKSKKQKERKRDEIDEMLEHDESMALAGQKDDGWD